MMDERRGNVFGLGASQPNSNFKQLSPYLNVDPSMLQNPPEFLMDQEMSRGKLENSFTAIGTGTDICFPFFSNCQITQGFRQNFGKIPAELIKWRAFLQYLKELNQYVN